MIKDASSSDIQQLTNGIPFSSDFQLKSSTARIIFQFRQLSDQSFQVEQLQILQPSAVLILIPKEQSLQNKIASFLKNNLKMIKQLKQTPIVAVMSDKGFEISNSLMKQTTEAHITTELNQGIVQAVGELLIQQRIAFRTEFLEHLGEDYSVSFQDNKGCTGM
ncbi:Hypothetical_protein [Hexamita inflata]|uniref:Hypothetical_protein n=1 Tax=Hexamita inflata TaxID=28002 RepID=A0AA86UAG7_9EUKA|nr:Hypothetical protein HINF_LOCUS37485 [Hexamita inflata]CAI9974543.1 Hypothetical protein HINF_LOCUS62188 [Hexamita inflata]